MFVTNTSYKIAPWADVLFAMDRKWWRRYIDDVKENFEGLRISSSTDVPHVTTVKIEHGGNSGGAALALAEKYGAKRIILLGYDCHKVGKVHWFGDHPKGLGNAGSIKHWPKQFARLSKSIKAEIINCSPGTALTCFKTAKLDDIL